HLRPQTEDRRCRARKADPHPARPGICPARRRPSFAGEVSDVKRFSLTGRLIATVVGTQLLLAIGLVLIGIRYSHHELMSAFDVNLQGRARSVAALVYYPPNNAPGLLFDADEAPASVDPAHPDIYQVSSPRRNFEVHTADFGPLVLKKMKAR